MEHPLKEVASVLEGKINLTLTQGEAIFMKIIFQAVQMMHL